MDNYFSSALQIEDEASSKLFFLSFEVTGETKRNLKHHKKISLDSTDDGETPLLIPANLGNKIQPDTEHGIVIDAGSTGSRLHVYEYGARVFSSVGQPLTFPTTHSRWTERLQPGISSFSTIEDPDELLQQIRNYLEPLILFAKYVLRSKIDKCGKFPIYFKATGGMRALTSENRIRIMKAVRSLFHDNTFCPFWFEDERARTISGEEEAIYGWTGINFLVGTMMQDARGQPGAVPNPRLTYGALDMGGASTQISFFEPNGDIMANLFKLQIGPQKHWNVYAHSFLYFGVVLAKERAGAKLVEKSNVTGGGINAEIYNPCLPGNTTEFFTSEMRVSSSGHDYWRNGPDKSMAYSTTFVNYSRGGNFAECAALARALLRRDENSWCDFAHAGDCSFAGIYQPPLPDQTESFGDFFAFSNFHHVWQFLYLNNKSSLLELKAASENICKMNYTELLEFNANRTQNEPYLSDYCFRSAYIFELLHTGYGFSVSEKITASNTLKGQKVGWALGAFLYEVNTLPWQYIDVPETSEDHIAMTTLIGILSSATLIISISILLKVRRMMVAPDIYFNVPHVPTEHGTSHHGASLTGNSKDCPSYGAVGAE